MGSAFIVEMARTPVGRRGGSLAELHPLDVASDLLAALVRRSGIDPEAVDDVIMGLTDQLGPQAGDTARLAWLAAGLPQRVPGVTIDRQCGSSQQAVHFAAQAVMSGTQDVVIAGGVQLMSVVPINIAWRAGAELRHPDPFSTSKRWQHAFGNQEISQFKSAEMIAQKWEISREEMERLALESHRRALAAIDAGRFVSQIEPVGEFAQDEGPRRDSTMERMAKLKPLLEGGRVTAATSSQISDAASAVLVCSEDAIKKHGLKPLARIHTMTVLGDDPIFMLTAPIPATQHALKRSGLRTSDIDLYEVNEAFASVVIAWQRELGVDWDRINVNGGAMSLGHPIGASGTRIMVDLITEMRRRGARYGLQTMCEGGGQANVTILEKM